MSAAAVLFDDPYYNETTPRVPSAIIERIDTIARGIESDFVAVGDCLVGVLGLAEEATAAVRSAGERFAGPEIVAAFDILEALPGRLSMTIEGLRSDGAVIGSIGTAVRDMTLPLDELGDATQLIAAISMNARIASASLIDTGETDLTVFSDDVVDLSRSAVVAVGRLRDEKTRIEKLVGETVKRTSGLIEDLATIAGASETSIAAEIQELRCVAQAERSWADDTVGLVSDLSVGYGPIIAKLQIGDATRQRLEHVNAVLRLPDIPDLAGVLQIRQIEACADDLSSDTAMIEGLLRERIDALACAVGMIAAHAPRKDISVLASLTRERARSLEMAEAHRTEHAALEAEIDAAIGRMGDQVAVMRDLEFSMRLVTLNTAISCSKLGDQGRALSAISLQLRELVGQMLAKASDVAAASERVAGVGNLLAVTTEIRNSDDLTTAIDRALEEMERALDISAEASRKIASLSGSMTELLAAADAALRNQAALGRRLIECANDLGAEFAAACVAPAEIPDDLANRLFAAYTMEAERRVHEHLLGGNGPRSMPWADEATDLSAILF